MMKKIILPLALFVLGYFGARELSSRGEKRKPIVREEVREGRERRTFKVKLNGSASEGFARRLREAEQKSGYWEEGREFFREWFRVDPDAAMEGMRTSPKAGSSGGVSYFLCFLFEEEADPAALQAMGERLDDLIKVGRWHERGFSGDIYREFNFAVGPSLVEKVESLPESYMKKDLWNYAMAGWLFADWEGAAKKVAELSGEERREVEVAFLSEGIPWRMSKNKEAQKWMTEIIAREGNRDLALRFGPDLARMMSRNDPDGALKWAGENLGGMALAKAVSEVVTVSYRDAPENSVAIVEALPPGGVRQQAARALIQKELGSDSVKAFERARSEEAAGMAMDNQLWLSVGRSLGKQKPEETRRIFAESEGELNRAFRSYAMESAFWTEPEKTKRWAEAIEGERRDEMIELVYRAWHTREQKEAKAWRSSLVK